MSRQRYVPVKINTCAFNWRLVALVAQGPVRLLSRHSLLFYVRTMLISLRFRKSQFCTLSQLLPSPNAGVCFSLKMQKTRSLLIPRRADFDVLQSVKCCHVPPLADEPHRGMRSAAFTLIAVDQGSSCSQRGPGGHRATALLECTRCRPLWLLEPFASRAKASVWSEAALQWSFVVPGNSTAISQSTCGFSTEASGGNRAT